MAPMPDASCAMRVKQTATLPTASALVKAGDGSFYATCSLLLGRMKKSAIFLDSHRHSLSCTVGTSCWPTRYEIDTGPVCACGRMCTGRTAFSRRLPAFAVRAVTPGLGRNLLITSISCGESTLYECFCPHH